MIYPLGFVNLNKIKGTFLFVLLKLICTIENYQKMLYNSMKIISERKKL